MAVEAIRFYLDENVPVVVADQLRLCGIEAVTVRDLGLLGDDDKNHLLRATAMGRVLCSYDSDYLRLASEGIEHAGIMFGQFPEHGIGERVKTLILYHAVYSAEEMQNRVEYL